jgi:integration host factor subunit beta
MNLSELIYSLAAKNPNLKPKDVEDCVKTIIDAISNTLIEGNRVEIRGFGSFHNSLRPPRKGRNPKTGESVQVPANLRPSFKAGKELRERVISLSLRY